MSIFDGMGPILTIGHSTRSFEELVGLLSQHSVRTLLDVRAHPGSRKFPQFARDALAIELPRMGLRYRHVPELGGRRRTRQPDPRNAAWRSASFHAYADHLASPEFASGLSRVLDEAARGPVALMCSEAVPWRCHRMLISDALTAAGFEVRHIVGPGEAKVHQLTPFARIRHGEVHYPARPLALRASSAAPSSPAPGQRSA